MWGLTSVSSRYLASTEDCGRDCAQVRLFRGAFQPRISLSAKSSRALRRAARDVGPGGERLALALNNERNATRREQLFCSEAAWYEPRPNRLITAMEVPLCHA